MGFSSQSGHLGIRTQASKGTYADPGAVAPNQGVFLRTRSGAMSATRELLVPDAEIGGNRDVPDVGLGPVGYAGEFDIYPRMESMATLLKGALGASATAGSALAGYNHQITPNDTLPWLSMEERIGNGFEAFNYTDALINTLHIEADAGGFLMGSFGAIAMSQALDATPTAAGSQRWDTSPLLVGTNIAITLNAVTFSARSFSMDITNNIEDDDYRLGSFGVGDLTPKRREVTFGFSVRPDNSTLWRQAVYGAPAATGPQGQTTKQQLVITITTYEDIPGATAGVKYQWVITVPKVVVAPFEVNPSGDDVLEHDIEVRAVRPDPGTALLTTTVRNSFATVA